MLAKILAALRKNVGDLKKKLAGMSAASGRENSVNVGRKLAAKWPQNGSMLAPKKSVFSVPKKLKKSWQLKNSHKFSVDKLTLNVAKDSLMDEVQDLDSCLKAYETENYRNKVRNSITLLKKEK